MPVDYDCERNWNKENSPPKKGKMKCVTFQRQLAKRTPLAELPIEEFIDEDVEPSPEIDIRGFGINRELSGGGEGTRINVAPKWKEIAVALGCDAEDGEEALMREVLDLCAWNEDHERPFTQCLFGRPGSCVTAYYSDEDEEDASFHSFIRRQPVQNFHPLTISKPPTEAKHIPETSVSSLRLNSRLSFSESGPSGSAVSQEEVHLMAVGCNTNSFARKPCSHSVFHRPPCGRFTSAEKLEQAFCGIVNDDNDVVALESVTVKESTFPKSTSNTRAEKASESIWDDVHFDF